MLIDSTADCLDKFYIMAFTSGVNLAGSDAGHAVEIVADGHVRNLELYDRPGNDYYQHKGDLWKYDLASFFFHFVELCLTSLKLLKLGKRLYKIAFTRN